jgi:hypothetical protein
MRQYEHQRSWGGPSILLGRQAARLKPFGFVGSWVRLEKSRAGLRELKTRRITPPSVPLQGKDVFPLRFPAASG